MTVLAPLCNLYVNLCVNQNLADPSKLGALRDQQDRFMYRRRKQFHFGGSKRNIQCDAVICTACMNINKVSRVNYWGAMRGNAGLCVGFMK